MILTRISVNRMVYPEILKCMNPNRVAHLLLPPGLNTPDVRRPDKGTNAVSPGLSAFYEVIQAKRRTHFAAGPGSRLPTHPGGYPFAVSGLGSLEALQLPACCSSVPKWRSGGGTGRSRQKAVEPGEQFVQERHDAVVVAVRGSTKKTGLPGR
ncbi:hypothetical protein BJV78DRAFT_775041 [Lactifluus subvellereus]|nr:hypothetical protein BJV78DRAFT_775041 [Lactifluus subvellereus]